MLHNKKSINTLIRQIKIIIIDKFTYLTVKYGTT